MRQIEDLTARNNIKREIMRILLNSGNNNQQNTQQQQQHQTRNYIHPTYAVYPPTNNYMQHFTPATSEFSNMSPISSNNEATGYEFSNNNSTHYLHTHDEINQQTLTQL